LAGLKNLLHLARSTSRMKIRSVEELEDNLNRDIAWRKKEMLDLKLLADNDAVNRSLLIRSGIALLCAHFEGFIKKASNYYVVFVSFQRHEVRALQNNFLGLKCYKFFSNIQQDQKKEACIRIVNSVLTTFEKEDNIFFIKYSDDNPIIGTKSNPTSAKLKDILKAIGIESDIFETKKYYIDYRLLEKRHSIVHGEKEILELDDFNEIFGIILELMDEYKDLIVNAADEKHYLKNAHSG